MSDTEPKRITRSGVKQSILIKDFKPIQPAVSKIAQEGRQLEKDLVKIKEFEELLQKTDSGK